MTTSQSYKKRFKIWPPTNCNPLTEFRKAFHNWLHPWDEPEIEEPLPEWSDRYGSEPITAEIVAYIWHYALLVNWFMCTRNEEKNAMNT